MANSAPSSLANEALARAIRAQAQCEGMAIAMGEIAAALDAGGNPHAILESGHSIMAELCGAHNSQVRYTSDARGALICFLMTRGANPLAWPEAFAKLPERSLAVAHDVMEGLVAQENAGSGYHTPKGGNALHCLAGHPVAWEDLRGWLIGKPRGAQRIHPEWIAHRDNAGKTFVHPLLGVPDKYCEAEQRISRWRICELLLGMDNGPDFLAPDQEGTCAADLIVEATQWPGIGGRRQAWEEMPVLRQAIVQWRATAEQARLEQATGAAAGPGRGRRL